MKHLFSKFLVSFFITSAVVLSRSEYFFMIIITHYTFFDGKIQKLTWDPVKIRPPWQSKQVRGWGCALTEFNHSSFKSSSEEYFTKFSQPLSETPLLDLTWSENNNFFLSKIPLMMALWTYNVEFSGFFCHSDFMWNQFWRI